MISFPQKMLYIHASILSLKHLKVIRTCPKYFQSRPLNVALSTLELFHETLPLPHLLFVKADDFAGF